MLIFPLGEVFKIWGVTWCHLVNSYRQLRAACSIIFRV